jgi:hypothetical protein
MCQLVTQTLYLLGIDPSHCTQLNDDDICVQGLSGKERSRRHSSP